MVPFLFRGLVTTSDDLTEKDWSNSANFRMGDCVEGLSNLVLGENEIISRILVGPWQMFEFDVQETLEKIDQTVDAVNCLDSVTRLPGDVYRDLSLGGKEIACYTSNNWSSCCCPTNGNDGSVLLWIKHPWCTTRDPRPSKRV